MTNLLSQLNQTAYQKPEANTKVKLPVFDDYIAKTLAKLDRSISDAKGRYQEDKAYGNAKPSLNWKVVKTDKRINNGEGTDAEVCEVWLKVGISKFPLGQDNEGNDVFTSEQPSQNLVQALEVLRNTIVQIDENRDSDDAQIFYSLAIKSARPNGLPSSDTNKGKDGWGFDYQQDQWIALSSEDEGWTWNEDENVYVQND